MNKFLNIYVGRRKKRENILIFTIIGFIGLGGIQRFVLGQIGMGLLFIYLWIMFHWYNYGFNKPQKINCGKKTKK